MSEKSRMAAETEAYLAKIRKTVSESKNLVESAYLRMAETDRMLESSGTTREEVMKFSFTAAQKEVVNGQLERMGFARLDEEPMRAQACAAEANFSAGDGDGSVENRRRRFNVMMQQFRM